MQLYLSSIVNKGAETKTEQGENKKEWKESVSFKRDFFLEE